MKATSAQAALMPTSSHALALGFSGQLGNIDAYISVVNRIPMLTHEEEISLARRLRDNNDLAAAQQLVLSHLRLVVSQDRPAPVNVDSNETLRRMAQLFGANTEV